MRYRLLRRFKYERNTALGGKQSYLLHGTPSDLSLADIFVTVPLTAGIFQRIVKMQAGDILQSDQRIPTLKDLACPLLPADTSLRRKSG